MMKILVPVVLAAVLAVGLGALMAGGWSDLDIYDTSANNALKFAVSKRNRAMSDDIYFHDVLEVVSIKSQVVAGIKYRITAKMAKTTCRKSNPEDICPLDSEIAQPYQCTFTIWSKPWENFFKVMEEKC